MQLPAAIQSRIDHLLEGISQKQLRHYWEELSTSYRSGQSITLDHHHALAYLLGRAPGTFSALSQVLGWLGRAPRSWEHHIDLGAGPGTACWAVGEHYPWLRSTALERSPVWGELAPELNPHLRWIRADVTGVGGIPQGDLLTAGYLFTELEASVRERVALQMWKACTGWLVIVEPGTPEGHATCLALRDLLAGQGAHVLAPCPGWVRCPLSKGPGWCHFGVRVNRSAAGRSLKGGTLSWDEEAFSYIALGRDPRPPQARILHHPQKRGGHLHLTLCTPEGLQRTTLSRRDGPLYRASRRLHWGASFPPPDLPAEEES